MNLRIEISQLELNSTARSILSGCKKMNFNGSQSSGIQIQLSLLPQCNLGTFCLCLTASTENIQVMGASVTVMTDAL